MKNTKTLFVAIALLSTTFALASSPSIKLYGGGLFGVSIGSILAAYLSWTKNKSILWAIIHFILGWLYVIYYFLSGGSKK